MFTIKAGDTVRLRDGDMELEVVHVDWLFHAECRWQDPNSQEYFTQEFHVTDLVKVSSAEDNISDHLAF